MASLFPGDVVVRPQVEGPLHRLTVVLSKERLDVLLESDWFVTCGQVTSPLRELAQSSPNAPAPGHGAVLLRAAAQRARLPLADALDDDPVTIPALWPLLAVVLGSVLVIAALTAIPARISARRRVAETLRSGLA
jgi:hypothetical protein